MKTANEWYIDACFAQGQPKLALEYSNKALELNPNFADAHYMKGNALNDLGKKQEAIDALDKAISLDPGMYQAHYCKGNALVDLKKPEEALVCFDKAISLDPTFSQGYNVKGNVLVALKRLEEADACFDKAIALSPNFLQVYFTKGNVLADEMKKYKEAIECFDKVISLNPQFNQAYYAKGNALASLKKSEEAIVCFDKVTSLDPDFHQAYYEKGNVIASLGRHEEAIEYFDKAISINFEFSQAYYTKGNALVALKNTEDAVAYFDRALEIDPKFNQAYYAMGNALVDLERTDEAYEYFSKGIELEPENMLYYCGRGRCLADLGKQQEALKDFAKAQELLKAGNVSSCLREEFIRSVKNTLKSIVELQTISNEAEVHMKELETQRDNPVAKKFAAKIQQLIQEKNKIAGKLIGQFGRDSNAETEKNYYQLVMLKKQLREELKAMRAEIKNLKSDVKELEEDVFKIKDELSAKLSDYKAKLDFELADLNLGEDDKTNLREYYRAFVETFSSIFVTSQIVDSGQVALDTGSTGTSLLSMIASFAPFIDSNLSSDVTTIGEFIHSQEMIKNARKMKDLVADSTELSHLIGKSGYEIVLNPDKQKRILKVTDEELDRRSENLLGKIREFCQKMGGKIDLSLYTILYKIAAARLGHLDANKLIELWINDEIPPYHIQKSFVEKIVSEVKTETKPAEKEGVPPTRSSCCNMF